jgi:hypothetical protein
MEITEDIDPVEEENMNETNILQDEENKMKVDEEGKDSQIEKIMRVI